MGEKRGIPPLDGSVLPGAISDYEHRADAFLRKRGLRRPGDNEPASSSGDCAAVLEADAPAAQAAEAGPRSRAAKKCRKCHLGYDESYHPGAPGGYGRGLRFCESAEKQSYAEWANAILRSAGRPEMSVNSLNGDFEARRARNSQNATSSHESQMAAPPVAPPGGRSCLKCGALFSAVFHSGWSHPKLRGWRHCPGTDGDYGGAVRRAIAERAGPGEPIPTEEELARESDRLERKWARRTAAGRRPGPSQ